ncbi:MAG: helix-turn-helix domain-containing protein [Candidatus Binataceae bacterium]|jgi:hypothetical protein
MAEAGAGIREGLEPAIANWAGRIPLEQIPSVVALLFARLVSEGQGSLLLRDRNRASTRHAENLMTANELARRLGVPESWVRSEERVGCILSIRLGKYVRFKLSEVERELAARKRRVE